MSSSAAAASAVAVALLALALVALAADALPYTAGSRRGGGGGGGYQLAEELEGGDAADPQLMLEILTRLGQTIVRANDMENSKRGLDLGLSRGFSGSQAAKHLMGLAAANYAGGPGRRRRDIPPPPPTPTPTHP